MAMWKKKKLKRVCPANMPTFGKRAPWKNMHDLDFLKQGIEMWDIYSLLAGKEDLKEKVTKLKAMKNNVQKRSAWRPWKKPWLPVRNCRPQICSRLWLAASSGAGRKYEGVQRGGKRHLKGAILVITERTRDFLSSRKKEAALQKSDQLESKREELAEMK